jgi:hypothetical protein
VTESDAEARVRELERWSRSASRRLKDTRILLGWIDQDTNMIRDRVDAGGCVGTLIVTAVEDFFGPVVGATVTLESGGRVRYSGATDADGVATFPGIPGGAYRVTVALAGYSMTPAVAEVPCDGTARLTIRMVRLPVPTVNCPGCGLVPTVLHLTDPVVGPVTLTYSGATGPGGTNTWRGCAVVTAPVIVGIAPLTPPCVETMADQPVALHYAMSCNFPTFGKFILQIGGADNGPCGNRGFLPGSHCSDREGVDFLYRMTSTPADGVCHPDPFLVDFTMNYSWFGGGEPDAYRDLYGGGALGGGPVPGVFTASE